MPDQLWHECRRFPRGHGIPWSRLVTDPCGCQVHEGYCPVSDVTVRAPRPCSDHEVARV